MTAILRGYDVDGTLTTGLKPIAPYVVISGRTLQEYDETIKRLAQDAPVYIRTVGNFGDQNHAAWHKAHIIRLLGVEEFYEDDPVQISIIKQMCPDCRIMRVFPDKSLVLQ